MTMMAIAAAAAELIPTGSGTIGLPDGLTMTPEKRKIFQDKYISSTTNQKSKYH